MLVRAARFPQDRTALLRLLEGVRKTDGVAPLGEVAMVDIASGPDPTSVGWIADGPRVAGYLHVMATHQPGVFTAEVAIDVRHREDATLSELVERGIATVTGGGGSMLGLWAHTPDLGARLDGMAGWERHRVLHRLERSLPPDQRPEFADGVIVRGFRVGVDEQDWLEVNNAAFAGHPEQGGWTDGDLARRLALDWFDPEGLRMAWSGESLVGSNWTKLHADGVGEIFVIGVSPRAQGLGLGRALTLEGLWDLWSRQNAHRATLYVDTANEYAMELYTGLGFMSVETHQYFVWKVPGQVRA